MSKIADLQARLGGGAALMGGLRPGGAPPMKKKPKENRSELDNATLNRPVNKQTKARSLSRTAKLAEAINTIEDEKKSDDYFGVSLVNDIDVAKTSQVMASDTVKDNDYKSEEKDKEDETATTSTTDSGSCELVENNIEKDSTITLRLYHNWQDFIETDCVETDESDLKKGMKIIKINDNGYGKLLSNVSGIWLNDDCEWQLLKIGKKNFSKKSYDNIVKELSKNSKFSGKAGYIVTFKKEGKESKEESGNVETGANDNVETNDNSNEAIPDNNICNDEEKDKENETDTGIERQAQVQAQDNVMGNKNENENENEKGNENEEQSKANENDNNDEKDKEIEMEKEEATKDQTENEIEKEKVKENDKSETDRQVGNENVKQNESGNIDERDKEATKNQTQSEIENENENEIGNDESKEKEYENDNNDKENGTEAEMRKDETEIDQIEKEKEKERETVKIAENEKENQENQDNPDRNMDNQENDYGQMETRKEEETRHIENNNIDSQSDKNEIDSNELEKEKEKRDDNEQVNVEANGYDNVDLTTNDERQEKQSNEEEQGARQESNVKSKQDDVKEEEEIVGAKAVVDEKETQQEQPQAQGAQGAQGAQASQGTQEEEKKMDDKSGNSNDNMNRQFDEFIGFDKCSSLLTWDEIAFINKEEKDGSMQLSDRLASEHGIENAAPFEMARFFIGSKCRVDKAMGKYLETLKFFKKYKFDEISNDQVNKCFGELTRCVDIGATNKEGYKILGLKANEFFPKNYESHNILLKSFYLLLNMICEDLNVLRNGIIFVGDMKKFGFKNFSMDLETLFLEILQNIYPLRVHAMYMVESPKLLEIALKVMRPLMKQKMKERMFIVTRQKLDENVSAEICPALIGGTYVYQAPLANDNSKKEKKTNDDMHLAKRLVEYNERMQSAYYDAQAKKWISKL